MDRRLFNGLAALVMLLPSCTKSSGDTAIEHDALDALELLDSLTRGEDVATSESDVDAVVADGLTLPDADTVKDATADGDPEVVDAELPSSGQDTQDASESESWRSALYPLDWSPQDTDTDGRFLHDFSYAGYHRGETPIPNEPPGVLIDVLDHGADELGLDDSTVAFQAAIDAASASSPAVVHVPAGLYRLDGQLKVTSSGVVILGEGAELSRLVFTKSEGMAYGAHLLMGAVDSWGVESPLVSDGEARNATVEVADAATFSVGQDVAIGWVISDAFVDGHGMTGTWKAFNGAWQPFFLRQIIEIDTTSQPHKLTLDVPLRTPALVTDLASVRAHEGLLHEVGLQDVGLANAVGWSEAWAQDQVHVVDLVGVTDSWVKGIASFPSPYAPTSGFGAGAHLQSGGLMVSRSKRVTIADSTLAHAQNIGGGGNGYLFEVRVSSEILTRDCVAHHGRHNFIQNWGFGTTGCVWLRVHSSDGVAGLSEGLPYGLTGYSEFHHSLATANLIDSSVFDDGFSIVNRGDYSTGAGHTGTENVLWSTTGVGQVRSYQFGWGYVIGTGPEIEVSTALGGSASVGTAPEDWREGEGAADALKPASLYEDQLQGRLKSQTPDG